MNILTFIIIYIFGGISFGLSIEHLIEKIDLNENVTKFERFLWVTLWPLFLLIFLIGMKK
jgi:Trk-type K+ transport system membrane component